MAIKGRAPRGARGLKWVQEGDSSQFAKSRPSRGAWIEMLWISAIAVPKGVAPLAGRVD